MNGEGLIVGAAFFVAIGLFHPLVIRGEYHFGVRIWPLFAAVGLFCLAASCLVANVCVSSILAVVGFCFLWSIGELFKQRERVKKGWFPKKADTAHDTDRALFAVLLLSGFLCLGTAHVWSRLGGREQGCVDLAPGESVAVSGMSLELREFAVPRYPGGRPRQLQSKVTLRDGSETIERTISINHPLIHRDHWIYQTDAFDPVTARETTLAAVRDRSLPLAAAGALLLIVGALWNGLAKSGIRSSPSPQTFNGFSLLFAIAVTLVPLGIVLRIVLRSEPPPALQSPLMAPHVGAYVASYVILLFAAFGIGRRFMSLGFLLMTLGLVLGGTWGQFCWMNYWQNDPKELASLATWFVYAAYFAFDANPCAERLLRWTGAAMILFTSTVVNFAKIFSGLHSYS